MKFLLLALMIFSTQTFASQSCDLNVEVSQYENIKRELISQTSYTSVDPFESVEEKALESGNSLIRACESLGAAKCVITERTFTRSNGFDVRIVQTAQGIKTTGRLMSDRKYKKAVKAAVCSKLDTCINNALLDNTTSSDYLTKLYSVQEAKDCK